jgi:hypothetical protein
MTNETMNSIEDDWLFVDANGHVYGTTFACGVTGGGVVFEVTQ